jgi:hypothetical protein
MPERKENYSGKKKRHTTVHQIMTNNNKQILAVGPAQKGSKHDKKIFDQSRVVKPPDMMGPWPTSILKPHKIRKYK